MMENSQIHRMQARPRQVPCFLWQRQPVQNERVHSKAKCPDGCTGYFFRVIRDAVDEGANQDA